MFRPTGQSSSPASRSYTPTHQTPVEFALDGGNTEALLVEQDKEEVLGDREEKLKRTFSGDYEEERTAGSGTDLLSESAFYAATAKDVGGDGDVEDDKPMSEESRDDQHLSCDQNLSGDGGDDEEVVAGEKEEGKKEEEEREKDDLSEMEKVNPSLASYMRKKRLESEQLRLKSESV